MTVDGANDIKPSAISLNLENAMSPSYRVQKSKIIFNQFGVKTFDIFAKY
jgi:hypothetical protein